MSSFSFYKNSFFKKLYFKKSSYTRYAGGNSYEWKMKVANVEHRWFGWIVPWYVWSEWPDDIPSWDYGPTIEANFDNGRRKWMGEIDDDFADTFIEKANQAYYFSEQGDHEELLYFAVMMAQFQQDAKDFLKEEHFESWRGKKFNHDLNYTDYGTGPWDKAIYKIYKALGKEGSNVIREGWILLRRFQMSYSNKLPWWNAYQKVIKDNSEESFIDFFNKFFLAYDLDDGGFDFRLCKIPLDINRSTESQQSSKNLVNRLGNKKGAWEQWKAVEDGSYRLGVDREGYTNFPPGDKTTERDWHLSVMYNVWGVVYDSTDSYAGTSWKERAKKIIEVVFPKFYGKSLFDEDTWDTFDTPMRDDEDRILDFFNSTGAWLEGEVPADLQKIKTWKKPVFKKAMRLIKRGMWLSPWASVMAKTNMGKQAVNASETPAGEERAEWRWKTYDPKIDQRVGIHYLQWGEDWVAKDTGASDDGFVLGYGIHVSNGRIRWALTSDDQHPKDRPAHFIRNGGLERSAATFKQTFHDGLAAATYGGRFPNVFAGKSDWSRVPKYGATKNIGGEHGNTRGKQGAGSAVGSPVNQRDVLSDEFFNGTEPAATYAQAIKRPKPTSRGDMCNWYKPSPTDPIVTKMQNFDDLHHFMEKYIERIKGGGSWTREKGFYGIYSKWNAIEHVKFFRIGNSFYAKDEDGNETNNINETVMGYIYQGFLSEYRKSLEEKNPEKQKTAEEFFNEATTYAAYSIAAVVLSTVRDTVIQELYDEFAKQTVEGKSASLKEMVDAVGTANSLLTDIAKDATSAADSDEDLTDEDIEERQSFYKQCFLLMNMDILKEAYQKDIVNCWTGAKSSRIHGVRNEYEGRIRMINVNNQDADKASIINRLTSVKGTFINSFFDARPELIGSLVPQLRLFRVHSDTGGPDGAFLREIEFDFPKHNNPDMSVYKGNYYGHRDTWEFGIKQFSFSFDGTNPATARNDIKCDLTLFFRDFNDLIKKRKLNEFSNLKVNNSELDLDRNKYSYLDLILFPGSLHQGPKARPLSYNASQFRIRADVGWAIKDGDQVAASAEFRRLCKLSNTTPDLLKQALEKINKSFYLNMIDHDLDFANDGSVTIKIKYRAYMESATKSSSMDVLSTPEINSIRNTLQTEMNEMMGKCNAQQMNELLNTYKTLEDELLKKSYQSILSRLLRRQRMMYVYSTQQDRDVFGETGYFEKRPDMFNGQGQQYQTNQGATATETEKALLREATSEKAISDTFKFIDGEFKEFSETSHDTSQNGGLEVVNYFYAGDLFHTLMDCMYDAPDQIQPNKIVGRIRDDVKNTKLLLPSFTYFDPITQEKTEINMAEIPIAVDFFLEFLTKNVVEGGRRTYPLMHFVRDLSNRLIVDLMSELCIKTVNPKQQIQFQTCNLLAAPLTPGEDPISQITDYVGNGVVRDITSGFKKGLLPFVGSLADSSVDLAYNYIVIYPVSNNKVDVTGNNVPVGIRSIDEENGIRHLYIGRDRGLVKTIKFSKVDMQYLREARFFNHGYNGLMQLGGVYRATIEMVGNTMFYPGMTLFINPTSLASEGMDPTIGPNKQNGPSLANALGIGGYHLVEKVKSTIEPGKFNTSVQAIFYYSGDKMDAEVRAAKRDEEEDSEREQAIEELQSQVGGTDEKACTSVIKIRQRQTANPFDPEFSQGLGSLGADEIDSKLNSIKEAKAQQAQALKTQQSAAQQQANKDAFEARMAALKKAGN